MDKNTARILEWVAISSLGDLPDAGIEPVSPASSELAGSFFTAEPAVKSNIYYTMFTP